MYLGYLLLRRHDRGPRARRALRGRARHRGRAQHPARPLLGLLVAHAPPAAVAAQAGARHDAAASSWRRCSSTSRRSRSSTPTSWPSASRLLRREAEAAGVMPDNWGFVAAAYGLAALVLGGYWRRLRPGTRARRRRACDGHRAGAAPRSRPAAAEPGSTGHAASMKPKFIVGGARHRRGARLHDLRGRHPVGRLLRHAGRAARRRRWPGKAYRLGGMVVPGSLKWEPRDARPVVHALRRQGHGAGPPQGHAARSLRRGARRGGRGQLDGRGLLQGDADHGQALRGVQGARTTRTGRLQGAHQDAAGSAR